ncbi:hypothetical protein N7528_003142 [Penicillium herquei]|nr:hypothetical protein N7528_003142 [Penicillium herquei]
MPDSKVKLSNAKHASNNDTVKFQVSAKHLIHASPIFKSMLTGGWKESVGYQQNDPAEITAEDWDVVAFSIVLNAVHGKFYQIPKSPTLEQVAKVSVIADYYQLKETISVMLPVWSPVLSEGIEQFSFRDLRMSVWASWFLGADEQFKDTTSSAMTRMTGQIQSLGLPIPAEVIDAMEKGRIDGIQNVFLTILGTSRAFLRGTLGCCFECRSIMTGALKLEQQTNGFLSPQPESPYHNMHYADVVHKVRSFKSPVWYTDKPPLGRLKKNYSGAHKCAHSSFAAIFMHLDQSIQGLELHSFVVSASPTLKRKRA